MRTSALVFLAVPLLLAVCISPTAGASATAQRAGRGTGGQAAEDKFYLKVGKFAVVVYSLWNDISPVPALERVVSASTRPAKGGGVDYLLVMRVAGLGTCRALVWGVPDEGSQDWKLKYFEPVAR